MINSVDHVLCCVALPWIFECKFRSAKSYCIQRGKLSTFFVCNLLKIKLTFWMTALSATNKFAIICSILNSVWLIFVMNFNVKFGFVLTDQFRKFFSLYKLAQNAAKFKISLFFIHTMLFNTKKRLLDDFFSSSLLLLSLGKIYFSSAPECVRSVRCEN